MKQFFFLNNTSQRKEGGNTKEGGTKEGRGEPRGCTVKGKRGSQGVARRKGKEKKKKKEIRKMRG